MMVLSVLSASILPHHHHLSRICFAVERCVSDGQLNDEHTSHSSSHNDDTDDCPAQGVKVLKVVKTGFGIESQPTPSPAATVVAVCAAPAPEQNYTIACASAPHFATQQGWLHAERRRGPPTV